MGEVNGVKWHVLPRGQRLTSVISPTGTGFDNVWEVTYQIDSGPAMGSQAAVNIPADQYNEKVVEATINAIVARQHGIASL